MAFVDDLQRLSEDGTLSIQVASRYLLQSYGDRDWEGTIKELKQFLSNKYSDKGQKNRDLYRTISFGIHLPIIQQNMRPNQESADILFRCRYFRQFSEKDWHENLRKIAGKDLEIYNNRTHILQQGVITNPQYQPYTRQAYNRLCRMAEETGAIGDHNCSEVHQRHKRFVQIYGGAVINSIFSEYENRLNRVINWATPYFFEHLIYKQYNLDNIIRMKSAELSKTSDALIQHIE